VVENLDNDEIGAENDERLDIFYRFSYDHIIFSTISEWKKLISKMFFDFYFFFSFGIKF